LIRAPKDRILSVAQFSPHDTGFPSGERHMRGSLAFSRVNYRNSSGRICAGIWACLLIVLLSFGGSGSAAAKSGGGARTKPVANFSQSAKSRKKVRRSAKRRTKAKRRRKAKRKRKTVPTTPAGRLGYAIGLAGRGKFDAARAQAKQSGLPGSQKLISWLVLQHTRATPTAREITGFLAENPDWPRRERLLARAEAAQFFRPETARTTLAYFKKRPPKTGVGMAALARAYKRLNNETAAKLWLRRAWTTRRLGGGLEAILVRDMGKWLRPADHLARAAFLTFAGAPRALMAIIKRLKDKARRAQVLAQASFLFQSKRAPRRLKAVPAALRSSPPLAYARSRYWRRKNNNARARTVLIRAAASKPELNDPVAWWKERRFQAREALGGGNPELAYALAAVHGLKQGLYFAQAEFLAGWIALVHLRQPRLAFDHFSALRHAVRKPRSIARAEYWLGRALRKLELPESAKARFADAAKYVRTYYGQLSRDAIGRSPSVPAMSEPPPVDPSAARDFELREPVRMARLLVEAKQNDLATAFLFAMADRATAHDEFILLARLARELRLPHVSIRIAKKAEARGHYMGRMAYPDDILPNFAQLTDPVGTPLIYSVIRQESEFSTAAMSRAGARGLMQLMPRTARLVARQHKQRYHRARLTSDPKYNLQIGSAHLYDLLENHRGSYIMALTSYNAGPGRTLKWAAQFGDPRAARVDPVNWIESIPFNETRNYVQKVMENLQVYRSYITPGESNSLTMDLRSGTPPPRTKSDARKPGGKSGKKKS